MRERGRKQNRRGSVREGAFQSQFKEFAKILDTKVNASLCKDKDEWSYINERRERLVKASRDVTQMSKKLIFALHRIKAETRETVLQEASDTAARIRTEIATRIAKEIDDSNYYVFHRAFSPGFQEYIEARTFLHYLKDGALLSLEALQEEIHTLCEEKEVYKMNVDATDYLLGIADLTGELMRRGVSMGAESQSICEFMRQVQAAFVAVSKRFSLRTRDLNGKISVMRSSVEKVERSCFNRIIRDAEMKEIGT